MKAFMDGVVILLESRSGIVHRLQQLKELFTWHGIKGKPKKRHILSIVHGQIKEIHFYIVFNKIPPINEQPVKTWPLV